MTNDIGRYSARANSGVMISCPMYIARADTLAVKKASPVKAAKRRLLRIDLFISFPTFSFEYLRYFAQIVHDNALVRCIRTQS